MSWGEVKKINSDLSVPLDTLIKEKSDDLAGMVSVLWPFSRRTLLEGASSVTYSTNTVLTQRVIYADVVTIDAGVVVTTMAGGVIFVCNSFVNNGTLTASGKGAPGGAKSVAGTDATAIYGLYVPGGDGGSGARFNTTAGKGGAAHSGAGAAAPVADGIAGNHGNDDAFAPFDMAVLWYVISRGLYCGAGGGGAGFSSGTSGQPGGGGIVIVCEIFTNNGSILAEGIGGTAASGISSGSGGGGVIVIDALQITAVGTLSVAGGVSAAATYRGGDGGDGMLLIMERQAA